MKKKLYAKLRSCEATREDDFFFVQRPIKKDTYYFSLFRLIAGAETKYFYKLVSHVSFGNVVRFQNVAVSTNSVKDSYNAWRYKRAKGFVSKEIVLLLSVGVETNVWFNQQSWWGTWPPLSADFSYQSTFTWKETIDQQTYRIFPSNCYN